MGVTWVRFPCDRLFFKVLTKCNPDFDDFPIRFWSAQGELTPWIAFMSDPNLSKVDNHCL